MPTQEDIISILDKIRIMGANTQKKGSDHEQLNRIVTWYSRKLTGAMAEETHQNEPEGGVALSGPIIRAYLSPCRSCKNCIYDCKGKSIYTDAVIETSKIRGPCVPVDITKIAKELFTYEQTG